MKLNLQNIPVMMINLPKRTDRLEKARKQLDSFYGENNLLYKIDGIVNTIPRVGIANAHMRCISIAKEQNWDYVCITEDDLFFTSPNSRLYANECFENTPEDFDILLGGVYGSPKKKVYNKYWDKVNNFCGLHYYIVSSKCYDKILGFDYSGNIDLWYGKQNGCRLDCYVTHLYFALQVDGYSDNVNRETRYLERINKNSILK